MASNLKWTAGKSTADTILEAVMVIEALRKKLEEISNIIDR